MPADCQAPIPKERRLRIQFLGGTAGIGSCQHPCADTGLDLDGTVALTRAMGVDLAALLRPARMS